ncbi:MAG: leishmanolysin-related zinc metalloendopeptidase [Pseudomonadota bacterium]
MPDQGKYERLIARLDSRVEKWESKRDRWEARREEWKQEADTRQDQMRDIKDRFEVKYGDRDNFKKLWKDRKESVETKWERLDDKREKKSDHWEEKSKKWKKKEKKLEKQAEDVRPDDVPESVSVPGSDTAALESYTSGLGAHGVTSDFNITVNFLGDWSVELQEAFIKASDYLSTLIVGDVQDIAFSDGTYIDDLTITAELMSIDGAGGVLGRAGPTQTRDGTLVDDWIPTQGIMEYDTADAQWLYDAGQLDDVVAHEMMHTLGFGTMWDFHGLTSGSIAGGDLAFTGENAIAAYIAALEAEGEDTFDIVDIPLEMDGGAGTAGSHWDEAVFTTELMTGWLNAGAQMSAMSLASLEDMGYDTIFNKDDPGAVIPQLDTFVFV